MFTSRLRAVDMAVFNLFNWANRITIADGVERIPEKARESGVRQYKV